MAVKIVCLDIETCQYIEDWNGREYSSSYSLPFVSCPSCNKIAIVTDNLKETLSILKLINEGFYD